MNRQHVIIFKMADRLGSSAPTGYSKRHKGSCTAQPHPRPLWSPVSIKANSCHNSPSVLAAICVYPQRNLFSVDMGG